MVNRIGDDVMEKELINLMMQQIEKMDNRLSESMVKQAELGSDMKHLAESVDEIKEDISEIQSVQMEHSIDIKEIKDKLVESQSFIQFVLGFAKEHPIITLTIALMMVNIILVSLGLPLIDIHAIWTALVAGGS